MYFACNKDLNNSEMNLFSTRRLNIGNVEIFQLFNVVEITNCQRN